jgi:hypothetical protein
VRRYAGARRNNSYCAPDEIVQTYKNTTIDGQTLKLLYAPDTSGVNGNIASGVAWSSDELGISAGCRNDITNENRRNNMAFSDFKNIKQVLQYCPTVKLRLARFLPDVQLELPDLFIENLNFALDKRTMFENEAFFCESFIFPFLQQTWKRHDQLKLWSHQELFYDDNLSGEPDYLGTDKK